MLDKFFKRNGGAATLLINVLTLIFVAAAVLRIFGVI